MTLNGSSSLISPGTNVSIVWQEDAESSGVNSTPEPSTLFSALAALAALCLKARRMMAARRT
jgi:hypothetical protein